MEYGIRILNRGIWINTQHCKVGIRRDAWLPDAVHSLGAADSVITAVALYLNFPQEIITSMNFGQPEIGNYAWAQWLKSLRPGITSNTTGGLNVYQEMWFRDFRNIHLDMQGIRYKLINRTKAVVLHFIITRENYSGVPFSWNVSPLFGFLRRSKSIDQRTRRIWWRRSQLTKMCHVPCFQEFVGLDDTVNDADPTDEYGTATS